MNLRILTGVLLLGGVLAAPCAARSTWFGGVGAYYTSGPPQSGFTFAMVGDRRLDYDGGGFDPNTNAFPAVRSEAHQYNSIAVETTFHFNGGGTISPAVGFFGFGVYGHGANPNIFRATWEPSGLSVPIMSYSWLTSTTSTIMVQINNPGPRPQTVAFAGFCLTCPPQHMMNAGIPPPLSELLEIPEFDGIFAPGETRSIELDGVVLGGLAGFYAESRYTDDPADGIRGFTWEGSIVPAPPMGLLLAGALARWAGTRRRR